MVLNPVLPYLKILFILLDADIIPVRVDAGYGRCEATGAIIQHRVTFIGVGADKVFKEGNGLLGGVKSSIFIIRY